MTTFLKSSCFSSNGMKNVHFNCPKCKGICVFSEKFLSQVKRSPSNLRIVQEKYLRKELSYLNRLFTTEEEPTMFELLLKLSRLDLETKSDFWKMHSGQTFCQNAPRSIKVHGNQIQGLTKITNHIYLKGLKRKTLKVSKDKLVKAILMEDEELYDEE